MPRVIHFEITAENPERAAMFYRDIFGWEIRRWDGPIEYWLMKTGDDDKEPGINGGLLQRREGVSCINTISVPTIDSYVARIVEHGGKLIAPKMVLPHVGYLAYCQDTEGNTFGLMQNDPSAE